MVHIYKMGGISIYVGGMELYTAVHKMEVATITFLNY